MLLLEGRVENVLLTPEGKTREGKEYGGDHQVQLLCREALRNGETRLSLFTLRCDDVVPFEKLAGKDIRVRVGLFARNNTVNFYLQKGAAPEPVSVANGRAAGATPA